VNILKYLHTLRIATLRYLQIEWRYKFQIVTDFVQLLLDVVAFGVLGSYIDSTVNPDELGINYDLTSFYLVGVLFWSFFVRSYEDTVDTIPEEASKGTIGFLITNDVNLSTILISRNLASTVKTFVMTIGIVFLLFAISALMPPSEFESPEPLSVLFVDPNDIDGYSGGQETSTFIQSSDDVELTWTTFNTSSLGLEGPAMGSWENATLVGVFTSKVWDTGPGGEYLGIVWEETLEGNATVVVQTRPLKGLELEGIGGEEGWASIANDTDIPGSGNRRYLQFRVLFFTTDNDTTDVTMVVDDVRISYKDPILALENPLFGFTIIVITFLLVWLFMISISLGISSLNIVFKKIRPFALMLLYGMKVFSGYYFPLEALEQQAGSSISVFRALPIVNGIYLLRDVVIRGSAVSTGYIIGELFKLFLGTVVTFIIAFSLYKYLENQSQKWGTLEFY